MLNNSDVHQALKALEARLTKITAERSTESLLQDMAAGAWIYGAGNYGQKIAGLMKANNLPCLGFIDKRAETLPEIGGLPVFAPDSFPASLAENRCFVLGVFNFTLDADDILPFADALPFRTRLWNADLPEAFGPEANTVWLSSRSFLLDNFESIRTVAMSLADEMSLETYLGLVLNRFTGKRSDYPPYDYHTQYMPTDLPGFDRPITFVDGGAFTGDTGIVLRDHGVELHSWLAFEPDAANFQKLAETVRESGIEATLFPCGLSDRLHQPRFMTDQGLGSHITSGFESDTITIQCVALDDAMPNVRPDFIKLDVEGAEIAALNGMARVVAQSCPRLAICAYHKPEDLWEIPLKMKELLPHVPLYVRQHLINGFETVFYAIPAK
jgi:FkbM family methyltransferase